MGRFRDRASWHHAPRCDDLLGMPTSASHIKDMETVSLGHKAFKKEPFQRPLRLKKAVLDHISVTDSSIVLVFDGDAFVGPGGVFQIGHPLIP